MVLVDHEPDPVRSPPATPRASPAGAPVRVSGGAALGPVRVQLRGHASPPTGHNSPRSRGFTGPDRVGFGYDVDTRACRSARTPTRRHAAHSTPSPDGIWRKFVGSNGPVVGRPMVVDSGPSPASGARDTNLGFRHDAGVGRLRVELEFRTGLSAGSQVALRRHPARASEGFVGWSMDHADHRRATTAGSVQPGTAPHRRAPGALSLGASGARAAVRSGAPGRASRRAASSLTAGTQGARRKQ